MRKLYVLIVLLCSGWMSVSAQTTQTFTYTGSNQTFVVPTGVTSISVKAWGAGGGGSATGGSGGSGALVKGTFAVTPGQSLVIVVGGGGIYTSAAASAGGFGGGGASGGAKGGSGGGYSGIFLTSVSQANAIFVAGAGAGGGYYDIVTNGGAGGATTGSNGGDRTVTTFQGGRGATVAAGGAAGAGTTVGTAGTALQGGAGGVQTSANYAGGGGGGGYYGGGGGYGSASTTNYSSGGGGGSSFLGTMTATTNTAGVVNITGAATQAPGSAESGYVTGAGNGGSNTTGATTGGNGLVVITYTLPPCTTPTSLATAGSVSSTTLSTIAFNAFTAAAVPPTGYVVVRSTVNTLPTLTSNTTYVVGANATVATNGYIEYVNTTPGSWTSTGLTAGTTYYYFIFSYNNTACNGPVYSATATTTTGTTASCITYSGTMTVGPTGTFSNLTQAIATLNACGYTGNIILELQSTYVSTGETFPLTFSAALGSGATKTITVRPATGASGLSITGSNTTAIIDLNGAPYITFDGRPGGTGSSALTISNTNTAGGSAFRFINEASNNTIRYTTLSSAYTSASSGIVNLLTTTGANGNDNNRIEFNNLDGLAGAAASSTSGVAANGIYSVGSTTTAATNNSGNIVSNNNIYNFMYASSSTIGVYMGAGNTAWTISGNSFYQTASRTATSTGMGMFAIYIASGDGYSITGNFIGGQAPNGGVAGANLTIAGTLSNAFYGITIASGATVNANDIQGNTVKNIDIISTATSTYNFIGINIAAGIANIGNTTPNIIGSITAPQSIKITQSTNSGGPNVGILYSGASVVNISNNKVGGIYLTTASANTLGSTFYGIRTTTGSAAATVSGNEIGYAAAPINSDCSKNTTTNTNLLVGISVETTGTNTITNNTISSITYTASGGTGPSTGAIVNGIRAFSGTPTISGNTISNLTNISGNTSITPGAMSLLGIYAGGTTPVVTLNTISNLSATYTGTNGTNVTGIVFSVPATSVTVSRNRIFGLTNLSASVSATAPGTASGIMVRDGNGAATYINNNMVALGNGATNNTAFIGIWAQNNTSTATTLRIYHNTVNIEGTATTGAQPSFGFLRGDLSTTANTVFTIDLKNNILVNNRAGGTGKHYAIANSYGATASATGWSSTASNNNILNGTAANIGYWTSDRTFGAWQTITNGDGNSSSGNTVTFTNSANDLHINMGATPTVIESGGVTGLTGPGATDDYDATGIRTGYPLGGQVNGGGTAPDLGADEFDGAPNDIIPPTIIYTTLTNTCLTTNITLSGVQITDATGVPLTGGLVPRIYYRKGAGSWFSAAGTTSSTDPKNTVWSFTIVNADMGGVAPADVISYYVIAQDVNGNITSNPATGLVATNVNTVTTAPTTPNTYTVLASLSGTYTVGTGQTYTNLTAAAAAYNTSCIGGPVVFSIVTNTTEPGAVIFNANTSASAVNTLTIKPASAGLTVSGSATSAVIVLNGADYVTIDGSIANTVNTVCPASAASRDLTITNTNTGTSSAVIWLQTAAADGATNNVVKNLVLTGNSNTTTLFGVGSGSSTISLSSTGTGNNNNSFVNNSISKTQYGIYSQGASAASKNTGTIINQNLINTVSPNNVARGGIYVGFENGVQISGNQIGGINYAGDAFAISLGVQAVLATTTTSNEVVGASVTQNNISSVIATSTNSALGIMIGTAASGTTLVANNTVSGVTSNATPGDFTAGIFAMGGTGSTTRLYYNTVSLSGDRGASTTSSSIALAIGGTNPVVDIKNNLLINKQTTASTGKSYAIGFGYSTFTNLSSNNNSFFTSGTNSGFAVTATLNAGTDRATLAALTGATSQDGASVSVDAVFSAPDLHIDATNMANVPLNAAAVVVSVTNDIDCTTRDASTPDIGADEFTPPACVTATGGTASAPVVAYCVTGNPTITATGYSTGVGSTYQWQSSVDLAFTTPVDIASQTNPAALTLPGAVTATTYYRLRVRCATNTSEAFSNIITITINPAITASISPTSPAAVCAPATVTLTATTSAVTPTYAWFLNGTTPVGTNSNTYAAPVSGSYTVTVTDATTCSITSSAVVVTVNSAPATPVITPSTTQNICNGQIITLSAASGGSTTFLNQNFNTLTVGTIPSGWTTSYGTPTATYGAVNSTLAGGTANEMRLDCQSVGTTDNGTYALAMPTFNATGATGLQATFRHMLDSWSATTYPYTLNFQTSTDGATWTTRWSASTTGSTAIPATPVSVDLSALNGQPVVYTRFALIGLIFGANYWYIDDAAITGTVTNSITWSPVTGLYTNPGATTAYTGTNLPTVYAQPSTSTTYIAKATGGNSCESTASILINVSTLAVTATHTDVLCFGANTGTITASATGGTTPYQYALNGGPYQVSPNFTGLTAGTYIVHVKDNNGAGCEATTTVTIAQPASAVSVSTTSVVNPVCNNGTTGSFTAVGAGGTAGYTYSLDNVTYQGTGVFTGLSGGVPYTVYAKDANGCVGFTNITLTNPPLITVGASNNGPVCEGGSLTLTATGGTSYVWSGPNSFSSTANPAIINPASLAAAGLYSVTVTDGNGCSNTATTNVVINPTVVVGATLIAQGGTNVCSGTTVTFEATATGGGTTPNYEFFVGGVSMQNGTSNTYSHVIAANESVYVIVTSNATCAGAPATSNTVNMVVTTSVAASVTIAADGNPVCAGTPVTFTATGIGTGASPTYNFFVNGGSVQNSASNTYTYTPTNGNTVYVIMTSSSGCATGSPATSSTISMTVNPIPTTPTIGASGPLTFCTGGSVTLTSSYAGAGNTWSTGATTSSIVVTTGGTYNVTYFDGNCNSLVSADVIVTVNPIPAAPVITAGGPTTFCTGGSVTLTSDIATGNTWSTGETTQSITVTTPGTYTVFQTVNGCPSANSNSIVVTVNPTPTVTASASCPSVFVGGSTTITASTSGSPTYQWYSNTTNSNVGGTLIPLATSATYNPPTGSAGTFYYYVQATVTGCPGLSAAVQIDVTNGPLNGTYTIGGAPSCTGFPTIAAATNYLNTNGLNGPVIFNVAASYSETTPAGGFVIGGTGSAIVAAGPFPTSSANTVTFNGNNAVITAAGNQTSGSLTDAIFKLVGADYITLQNFTMQENAANATTSAASNNMTEFGVALLYATTTDGAQNNTIANNNISLNRTYTNTYGIYSSTRHSAAATITTPALAEVTSAAGSNSFNKVYTNAISNVNVGISFIGAGTTIAAIDNGNDIGGSSSATGNTITNWGGAVGATAYPSTIAANYAILANQQINDNISYNNITSAALTSAASTGGILKIYSVASPTSGTITSNINNNTVTVTNNPTASTTGGVVGINNQGLTPLLSTATVNMNNNTVTGCRVGGTTSTTNGITGITNLSLPGTINITGNTVTNHAITATTATSGSLIGISNSGAAGTVNITNNTFTAFASTATSGQTAAISNSGAAVTAINLNNNFIGTTGTGYFSSTVASSGTLFGISNSGGAATSALSIQNNDIRGISYSVAASAAQTYHVNTAATLSQNISNNTFTNLGVNTTGNATFISNSVTVSATGTQTISNNRIITGYTKGGAGGAVVFITSGASSTSGATINWSNNIISNVTISGATTATFLSNVDGGSANKNFTGNTISNITGGTGTIIGISNSFGGGGGGLGNVVSGNTISGITSAGTITGINIGVSGTANTVFGNTVSGFTGSGTGAVTGITSGSPTSGIFYNNKIYDLANNNAGGSVIGFAVTGGTLHNVYNNIIGNLTAPNLSATNGLIGMNFTGGTTINASFNTTMLNATSVGTNFGSSALSAATAVSLTLRNNIFVNNSVPNGTGIAVAYRRSSTTLTSYQAASNTNLFYAGATPSATRAIYTDGTNTDQTLAAFKTRMATRDQLSVTENPPFLSTTGANANFLHISTVVATQIESGGVPVTGITDDYDADTRSSTPDIGADEFIGIPIDNNPPIISYTPLGGSCTFGTNQVLTATISDASGVPTTGIGLPVLYFRVNAGAYTAVQGVSIGSNQYTFTFGNTTTAAGDVVSYYVVAQDNAGTPNVGAFPSAGAAGFTANPPAVATPPTTPSSYTVTGTLNGTYTVGVGQAYTTLTAAVADYNSKCLSGAVIFSLTDATYPSETFPIAINNNTYANSTNTLTIKPATGVTPLITGSNATAIIHVNGGKYVTIDGSNTVNGTTRDLTISNTSTTGSTIRFTNVAANSTIKNAVLTGVTTSTSNAVVLIGSSVTTANTNITVQNNTITKGATLPAYGVLNSGSSALANTNVLITGNSISDFSLVGVMDAGNSNGMTVTKNNIFGTVTQTTSSSLTGIVLGANTVVSPVITGNKIYDLKTGNTSTNTSTLTGVLTGIDIFDIASGTTALIANNMISLYGTGAAPGVRIVGIADESTVGTSNIYYNSVSINGTGTAASSFAFLKNYNNTTNLRNNILSNTRVSSGTSGQYAIANTNTGTFSSNYNDLYSSGNSLNVVGSFGSTNYATLPLWQAASGGDANSISADPSFTSANDLHVSGSSPVNAAATPIAGITTDIDGDTRNATTPDIGADEFTPTNNDAGITDFPGAYCPGSPANVTVTLKNFGLTNLTSATINWSVNGVPQTPYTWAGTLAPGATANVIVGTYTFNGSTVYTLTGSTSLPNGVPDEGPSNDSYTATNVRTSLSGTYTVGTAGDFTTLTAAVAAANNYGLCGPTTFNLTNANYTAASGETFPITINQLTGASAVNTLTIKPNTGVSPVISGSNEVILKLNGADYITIDGSNTVGGSTRNLTVQNTSTSTTSNVIWIASVNSTNGALNNTIKNSIVKGSGYQNTSTGIITSGSTAGNAAESGNDNTSIVNNLIQATAGGISVIGKTTTMDQNVLIKDNNLGSTVTADKMGFIAMQIVNQANGLITGNSIIGLSTTATTYAGAGIDLFGMHSNMIIEKNVIGDIKNTNSTGFGVVGILLESDNTAANITVRNNFVYNVAAIGYTDRTETDNGYGIGIVLGGGYKIYNNTVSLDASQSATGYPSCLLVTDGVTTVGSIDLRNNIFTNTQTQSGQRYAIQSTANSNVFSDINYNDYYTVGNNLGYIGSNRANLAAIQTGFGKNVNSVNILPTFISATNLHIDPSAAGNVALNNLGTPIADVTTDIDADLRNELTPDMGADEFDPCSATMLTWTGKISTDWNVGGNWCSGAVPTAANSVVIPAGVPSHNYPVLGTTGAANNVTINTSVNDVIIAPAGILSVAGNFVNNGKMTNNGTIRLNGTALQTFPGPGLIGTVGDMANLEIANTGAGVKVTKAFGITNELKPTSGALDLDAYDVTIRSTFAATAHVSEVKPAASFLYSGTGRFVVERFINTGNTAGTHKRTWQFLSVPTTTAPASTAQTIKSAWQEGAATPGDNPVAGFGTRLSSPRFVAAGAPNGFDEGLATAGPGIKTYRGDVDDWDQGPNSTNEAIANPKGWMVFVRGDRTVSGSNVPTAPTTLRTRGALITGTQTDVISINSDKYGSVGNPYASSIDLTKVDTLNVTNEVYIWDPTLGDGSYGFGRFRTLTKVGNHYEAIPYGGAYPAGINDTIQSGQAFFYKARTGATATIGFKETAKLSGSRLVNRGGSEGELLTVTLSSLLYPDAPILLDGAAAIFGDFSGKVDSDDGLKIANSNENIGFRRSGSLLAVERRPEPVANDTLHLDFNSAKQQSYNWKIAPRNMDAPGRTAWLVDKFLNTTSSISLTDTSSFNFVVNNNAASYAADRFKIVFKVNVVLPVTITSISAVRNPDRSIKVRWSVENELNIDKYEVERSADGIRFSGIITNAATNSRNYAKDDLSPLSQDNYYRIKATSNNGQVQYSAIVKVAPLKTDGLISVYPNPVEGKIINLRFTDMTEGSYQLQLTNKLGQVVYSGMANVTAAAFVKNITLSKVVTAGTYQMKIIDADGKAVNIQVVVQ